MERAELARLLGGAPDSSRPPPAAVVVDEAAPERFMTAFRAAACSPAEVFLADSSWRAKEREQLRALVGPGSSRSAPEVDDGLGWLMIPSGGTTGPLKFARHDARTIAAAVRGFGGHFGLERVNAIGVLPLHHVGGVMAWMRCALTGGEYVPCDWKALEAGHRPARPAGDWTISLVPTQLQRLLVSKDAVAWLRGFRIIFVGGGPMWPELGDQAARAGLPISLTYGMTETAAMVTALRPDEFLAGGRSCGTPLPHARVAVTAEGTITLAGDSLFRGYYPAWRESGVFASDDLGRLDEQGHLHVLARRDAMIITGGKKVQPSEVEAVLRASGAFSDVAVIGVPDPEWGEAVVACYPGSDRTPNVEPLLAALPPHQRPKRFVAVAPWPRNAQGKLNRAALVAAATIPLSSNR